MLKIKNVMKSDKMMQVNKYVDASVNTGTYVKIGVPVFTLASTYLFTCIILLLFTTFLIFNIYIDHPLSLIIF